jgi:hypothetical protein
MGRVRTRHRRVWTPQAGAETPGTWRAGTPICHGFQQTSGVARETNRGLGRTATKGLGRMSKGAEELSAIFRALAAFGGYGLHRPSYRRGFNQFNREVKI